MPVIAYYIKLFLVEELLGLQERTEEVISYATRLLDEIELFKQKTTQEPVVILLKDQTKAKTYFLNFALSLYNDQLRQIQQGKIGPELPRALWCCLDLFRAFVALWKESGATETEIQQCQKRVKFCKVYLSKLARGDLNAGSNVGADANDDQGAEALLKKLEESAEEGDDVEKIVSHGDSDNQTDEEEELPELKKNEIDDFIKSLEEDGDLTGAADTAELPEDNNTSEKDRKDTEELIRKMRELESDPDDSGDEVSVASDSHAELTMPSAPSGPESHPKFIDDAGESKFDNIPSTARKETPHFKPEDFKKIWNRQDQVNEVQRSAKFAISALNYEDLKSAKAELTKALQLLEEIE